MFRYEKKATKKNKRRKRTGTSSCNHASQSFHRKQVLHSKRCLITRTDLPIFLSAIFGHLSLSLSLSLLDMTWILEERYEKDTVKRQKQHGEKLIFSTLCNQVFNMAWKRSKRKNLGFSIFSFWTDLNI